MSKKLFCVETREVWTQPVYVLAESHEDARKRVQDGEGVQHESGFEFSHTMGPEYSGWPTHEVQEEKDIKFFTELLQQHEVDEGLVLGACQEGKP